MGHCGGQPEPTRGPMTNKNIIAVTSLIRRLGVESLKDPDVVADLVRSFGLVQWGPPVFGADEVFKNTTEQMAGIYQTPCQLGRALVYLSEFKIDSYLEIGVFQGGCFLFVSEYLRRFNPGIVCLGIDPTNYLNPEVREIIELSDWMKFAGVTSDKLRGRKFDLVFIDGAHENGWTRADWENVGKNAKVCMFHDVQETSCPEVVAFWDELKQDKKKTAVEFLECQTDVPLHGIGIITGKEKR